MLPVRTSCHDSRYRHPAQNSIFITVVIRKVCSSLVLPLGSECLVKWEGFWVPAFSDQPGWLGSPCPPKVLFDSMGTPSSRRRALCQTPDLPRHPLTTSRLCLNSIWQTAGGSQLRGAVRDAWATFACAFCSTFTKKICLHFPAVWHPTTRQSTGNPKWVLQVSLFECFPDPLSSDGPI